ncbi:MAG: hypothetical protein Q4Q07_01055 [Tissierellia bacterium]|nr:hypothetical protein [Tissierellia bacterium]
MIPFFRKKKNESIFQEMTQWKSSKYTLEKYPFQNNDLKKDLGELELAYLNGEYTPSKKDVNDLDTYILGYFSREFESPKRIDEFFKTHQALDVYDHFLHWTYMGEGMEDPPFKGLSIYLMQHSKYPETVKFGILLAHFYDLMGTPGAVSTIELLGKWPAFTYYGIEVFKNLPMGQGSIFHMSEDTFGNGKKCMANFVEERLNLRGGK